MKVHASNLHAALLLAIKAQRESEKDYGYVMDSGFLAGLEQVVRALRAGEPIEVTYLDN